MFDRARMLDDVRAGLLHAPRSLPPKYFYDERGSELFEEITHTDEYYPTRTERALLTRLAPEIVARTTPCTLTELGAGSASKTQILLDAMLARTPRGIVYVPVDVSAAYLEQSAARLRDRYPALRVEPVVADFSTPFHMPPHPAPALHAFLGSTIGNFVPREAATFLETARARMDARDHFLLGADLRKDPAVLERAYNDARGVTAQFNRNVLRVLDTVLGADFDPEAFEHRAVYDTTEHRIEMYLVAREPQRVTIPEVGVIDIAAGEPILTEVSYKYDRSTVEQLLDAANLALVEWYTDPDARFALALARPAP